MTERLWRVRRRQRSIDAILRPSGSGFVLEFVMNGKPLAARRWPTRTQAETAALERRHELERAGWTTHW